MRKILQKYYLLALALGSLFFSHTAFAACVNPAEYELIAPFGTLNGCVDLTKYLSGMLETVIGIAGVLAVVMIVVCGIKLMSAGSVGGKSEAKECITNALFGVLLAISSYVILNTINPLLLKKTPSVTPVIIAVTTPPPPGPAVSALPIEAGWYFRYIDKKGNTTNSPRYDTQQTCAAQMKSQTDAGVSITNSPQGKMECFQIFPASQPLNASEAAVRTALCGNNSCVNQKPIGINTHACRYAGDPASCTNVGGLGNASVIAIQNLQTACGCNIIITGGTEYWKHNTHAIGSGVFDLRWDGDATILANTIKSQGSFKMSFSGNHRWLYNGFWYTDEVSSSARHWHVCPVGAINTKTGSPYSFCI